MQIEDKMHHDLAGINTFNVNNNRNYALHQAAAAAKENVGLQKMV